MDEKKLAKWKQEIESKLGSKKTESDLLRPIKEEDIVKNMTAPQKAFFLGREKRNLFLAGQGSGKTYCMGDVAAYMITNFPELYGFIAANTDTQLSDSTFVGIFNNWKSKHGWEDIEKSEKGVYCVDKEPPSAWGCGIYKNYDNKIFFKNGAVVFTGSLTNVKAHDGKHLAYMLLDETKDTKQSAFDDVLQGRLRQIGLYITKDGKFTKSKDGNKAINPLWIFTTPAVTGADWLVDYFSLSEYREEIEAKIYSKDSFFQKKEKGKYVCISSTHFNTNVSESYIEAQEENLSSLKQQKLIYANPFAKTGVEFYHNFAQSKHVRRVEYNPNLPLHITFDFNVSPGVHLNVWQVDIVDGLRFCYLIDEILLNPPHNRTKETCAVFAKKYFYHTEGLFIYGDASGRNEATRTEANVNEYSIIKVELSKFSPVDRVCNYNPSIAARSKFINEILGNEKHGIKIIFDEKCTRNIAEYSFMGSDINGKKDKRKWNNPITGKQEEKYGHPSDANDMFFVSAFYSDFLGSIKPKINTLEPIMVQFSKNQKR